MRRDTKPAYLEHRSPELLQTVVALDPSENPPREPILTLPGALTAYVGLLAAIHVIRLLLPGDLDYWTIELFGFIPKR